VNIHLFDAVSNVSNVIALLGLRDERQNAETRFVDIWNDSKALAQYAQTELVKPRQASRRYLSVNSPELFSVSFSLRTLHKHRKLTARK